MYVRAVRAGSAVIISTSDGPIRMIVGSEKKGPKWIKVYFDLPRNSNVNLEFEPMNEFPVLPSAETLKAMRENIGKSGAKEFKAQMKFSHLVEMIGFDNARIAWEKAPSAGCDKNGVEWKWFESK